jgi:hypothetical protein
MKALLLARGKCGCDRGAMIMKAKIIAVLFAAAWGSANIAAAPVDCETIRREPTAVSAAAASSGKSPASSQLLRDSRPTPQSLAH